MKGDIKYQVGWAWAVTKGYRARISGYMLLEIAGIALSLMFVYWSKHAVDIAMGVSQGQLRMTLYYIISSVVLMLLVKLWADWIGEHVRDRLTIQLQNSLIESQMTAVWGMASHRHTGDLLVRINKDCEDVVQMLGNSTTLFLVTCVKLVASLGFLWIMEPMLAWMILAISPMFLFSKLYFKKMRALSQKVKQAESNLGTVMQENLKFRLLIRALGAVNVRNDKLAAKQEEIFSLRMRQLVFTSFTQGIMRLTFNGGYLLAFLWGVYRLHTGLISVGTMMAFLQLVGRIQSPMQSLIAFVPSAIRSRTAIDRLLDLYQDEREKEEVSVVIENPDSIHIDNVTFRYEEQIVLKNLNSVIRRGSPTAIIGSSGKGKTTLIRLILSLIKPEEGELWIEANNTKYPVSKGKRTNFAYVPQGNTLFSGTIRENLTLAFNGMGDSEIDIALRAACAEFVHELPQGLDTKIGESGYGLSEGQAQRLSITRALLRNCSIWLFDEATSALDSKTSERMINQVIELGRNKIIIFVTHDLRLAGKCANIIQLENQ